jgi:hypothetical protein
MPGCGCFTLGLNSKKLRLFNVKHCSPLFNSPQGCCCTVSVGTSLEPEPPPHPNKIVTKLIALNFIAPFGIFLWLFALCFAEINPVTAICLNRCMIASFDFLPRIHDCAVMEILAAHTGKDCDLLR